MATQNLKPMKIGILFPQTEIGTDPGGLREFARALVDLKFDHIVTYVHVLGAVPERLPKDYAPYGIEDVFHEVCTLFAFLAGVAPELGMASGILVLPQRQTPLVAKQAVQLDLLTGGRFRLGVGLGWNRAEFEGMGCAFTDRAARMEEQIEVLRKLWSEPVVNFKGRFHDILGCGIRPLPVRPIPLWVGGAAEKALQRAAQKADGFFPLRPLEGGWEATLDKMREWREEAGLSWQGFGIEARVSVTGDNWRNEMEEWRRRGATHLYLNFMGLGLKGPGQHIAALQKAARELIS